MYPYKFTLSFRLTHPTRDLEEIYKKLSKAPVFSPGRLWKVGDQRRSQQGAELEGTYNESYCYLTVGDKPQDSSVESLSSAIGRTLMALYPLALDLHELTKSGGGLEFFVGLHIDANSGITFDVALLRKLSDLEIELGLDIYPPDLKANKRTLLAI